MSDDERPVRVEVKGSPYLYDAAGNVVMCHKNDGNEALFRTEYVTGWFDECAFCYDWNARGNGY